MSGKPTEEYKPIEYVNAKIAEVSSQEAVHALIISLQDNAIKDEITKKCLKNVYQLDEMPTDKSSSAVYCNPDTYTIAYLGMLFGNEKADEKKNAKWWLEFWNQNHNKLKWNSEKGIYEIKK